MGCREERERGEPGRVAGTLLGRHCGNPVHARGLRYPQCGCMVSGKGQSCPGDSNGGSHESEA